MDDISLDWKKELGWEKDPFSQQNPRLDSLPGYDSEKKRLESFVKEGKSFGTVYGSDGVGKSLLLSWFAMAVKREHLSVVMLTPKDFSDEKALVDTICAPFHTDKALLDLVGPFLRKEKVTRANLERFLSEEAKRHRFLLVADGVPEDGSDLELLGRISKAKNCSVIVASGRPVVPKGLKDELTLEVKRLSAADARAMVKSRIEAVGGHDVWPFQDKMLKDLFSLADYNPRRILALCQEKAKELAMHVKSGKIPDHEVSYGKQVTAHDSVVTPPHSVKEGFGIKFTFVDDDVKVVPPEIVSVPLPDADDAEDLSQRKMASIQQRDQTGKKDDPKDAKKKAMDKRDADKKVIDKKDLEKKVDKKASDKKDGQKKADEKKGPNKADGKKAGEGVDEDDVLIINLPDELPKKEGAVGKDGAKKAEKDKSDDEVIISIKKK